MSKSISKSMSMSNSTSNSIRMSMSISYMKEGGEHAYNLADVLISIQ